MRHSRILRHSSRFTGNRPISAPFTRKHRAAFANRRKASGSIENVADSRNPQVNPRVIQKSVESNWFPLNSSGLFGKGPTVSEFMGMHCAFPKCNGTGGNHLASRGLCQKPAEMLAPAWISPESSGRHERYAEQRRNPQFQLNSAKCIRNIERGVVCARKPAEYVAARRICRI